MRQKKNTKEHDIGFLFWLNRDILTSQRHRLKEQAKARSTQEPTPKKPWGPATASLPTLKSPPARALNSRVSEPPPVLYEIESVYRFTRGNNDLTNPGMGYGELTEEGAWELQDDGSVRLRLFYVRRTRSARRRLETENPAYLNHSGVISHYPPPRGEKGK